MLSTSIVNAQTTYYSQGSINFNASGAGTWNTAIDGSGTNAAVNHEDGGNNYIILNGHTVTINDNVTANSITVGEATTSTNGTLIVGDGTAGYTITLAGAFSVRSGSTVNTSNTGTHTHSLSIGGDITLAGTVTFANSNTVNMTMTGSVATILSGSGAITLDNLTINGGVARIISTTTTPVISGDLLVDGAGTEVSISSSLNIAGNYTISNGAVWNSINGTITFDGNNPQTLSLTGGTATFFGLTFDNGTSSNLKTINGDLVVNGTTRITNDAFLTSTNRNHQLEDLRFDASDGSPIAANFSGGSVTFRGYNGSNPDIYGNGGNLTFQIGSSNCNIIIQGNTWIQAGDNVRVAGNIDLQSGYLLLNGSTPVAETYTVNSTLKPVGGVPRSFTMATNTNLYIRGADNFPLYSTSDPDGYFTFTFGNDSWVRYDAESHQTVRGNATGYPTVNYNNLLLSQISEPTSGNPRLDKTLATGHTLDVEGQFRLANGIEFIIPGATTHTFAGNITIDDAAVWTAATATITLDAADASQTMQGNGVTYNFGNFVIVQSAPTAVRIKTIQADINITGGGSISITNPGGSAANYLQVNLNTFVFSANNGNSGTNDFFTLGENCRLITTGVNFLTGFADAGDNINIHPNSIVRFDLNGDDQVIPDIGTNYYGTIELWGNGRKFPAGTTLNIAGDMRVVAYTPVFQFRQYVTDNPININIQGDWDMNIAWTDPYNGASNNSTITFEGADQYISSSDFHNVVFAGTGTKTVNGTLNIEGSLTINTGVTVDLSDNFVQIDEDWTVNGTGKFTQTTGTTRFEGGTGVTTQTITIADPTQSYFGNLVTDNNITLVFASDVRIARTLDTDDTAITTPENGSTLSFAGRTISIGNDFYYRRSTSMAINSSSKLVFNGDTDQSIQYLDDTDGTGDGADNPATNDIDDDNDDVFPTIEFDGVGRKVFVARNGNMWWLINGNLTIGNSSTVAGNNRVIVVSGNWTNEGSFLQNGSTLVFTHIIADTNPNQNISTSTFHSTIFGSPNGILSLTVGQNYYSGLAIDANDTGTKTLLGNLSLSGNLTISGAGAELTALNCSSYDISVAGNWTNNGTFTPGTGSVTFNGSGTQTVSSTNGTATDKRFNDLNVIKSSNTTLQFSNTALVSSRIDVLGNLTITSGIFSLNATGTPSSPNDLYIAGSFSNSDIFTWNDSYNNTDSNFPEIIFNGTSGTHTINFGIADIDQSRNVMGRMRIDAPGATYQLATNTFFIDDTDCSLTIANGTLDLNSWRLTMGRGGISQSGGTLSVDAGAVLVLNATTDLGTGTVNTSPDYINAGGTLSIVGTADATATITSESTTNGFQYVQTSGNTTMQYYTVSNSESGGMEFNGGTVSNLSNGTFTGGSGTAYMTFSNVALGTISASNVVFNAGPTSNLSTSGTGMSGAITFVIAGGTLAGAANETDVPDGGAATGFFQWDYPDGWYWEGDVSTDWHTSGNWSKDISVVDDGADGLPDPDDFVYIGQGYIGPHNPTISSFDVTVSRITIDNPRNLTLASGRNLTVLGNITNAGTITTTDNTNTITLHGSWASDASTSSFVETQSTVIFKGATGSYSISTRETSTGANIDTSVDPFYNLTINSRNLVDTEDGDAVYAMGSHIRVSNNLSVTGGTLDASTGFILEFAGSTLTIGDGGVLNPGTGSVYINGTSGTQTISGGTFYNLLFRNAAAKSIGANILVEGTITFENVGTPGTVSCNDKTIYVGDDWTNNVGTSVFDEGTGTVVFYQQSGLQVISGDTEFYKLVFQNAGTKQVAAGSTALTGTDIVVRGDLNMISDQNNILQILQDDDLAFSASITGVGTNNFNMTGGTLQVFGNNFPTNFASYNFTAGTVDYRGDRNQNIVGNLSYYNLTIRTDNDPDINGGTAGPDMDRTKTLLDDIIIQGVLTIDDNSSTNGQVIFVPNGKTITLAGNLTMGSGSNRIDWNNQGTLIHNGAGWAIDADIQDSDGNAFHNLTLQGSGTKTMYSNLNISGSVFIDQGVTLNMGAYTMTGDGGAGDTFTMEESSALTTAIPDVTGEALPLNFATYALNETSTVTLKANVNQTVSNDAIYGHLILSTNGTATLAGNIYVNGNFTSNSVTTLVDGGFNMELNGTTITINNYPSPSSTITFARGGDQTIQDNTTAAGDPFILNNVVFSGSGTKTLTSNNGSDYYDINGNLTVNSGVTVTTTRLILFGGTNFTNNGGAFYTTSGTYPMTFDRASESQTINPGATNGFEAITFTGNATKTVTGNGFNIENTAFNLIDGGIVDFGNLTHTLACATFNVDPSLWDVADANLIFDRVFLTGVRNGNQQIPGMTVNNVTFAGSDTKTLIDNLNANNVTINEGVALDVNASGPYNIVVRGNWLNNGGAFQPRTGTVYFESTSSSSKTITPATSNFYNVIFHNEVSSQAFSSTYTLVDDLIITEDMTINAGATLDVNDEVLTLGNDDQDDPAPETQTIAAGGTLKVGAGGTLQFDCTDDLDNTLTYGAVLDVLGTFELVGTSSSVANLTRSGGGNRIDIDIEATGKISARYYHIQYLVDEGLQVKSGAEIDATNNFSNGTWSNMAVGNAARVYLELANDGADIPNPAITGVTFNYGGTPNTSFHRNVKRDPSLTTIVTFSNTGGLLGNPGSYYEFETGTTPAPPATAHNTGILRWDAPTFAIWEGDVSNDWHTAANWVGDAPPSVTLPNAQIGAGNPYPCVIANTPVTGTNRVYGNLTITNGILKLEDANAQLDVDGDFVVGQASGSALLVANAAATITVGKNFTIGGSTVFEHGNSTVVFDAAASTTATITPGTQPFYNVSFTNGGLFNYAGGNLYVDNNLTLSTGATVTPSNTGYNLYVKGNIVGSGATFNTGIDGEVILDGAAQTITDINFDELTVQGTGVKDFTVSSASSILINDNLIIRNGATLRGSCTIDIDGSVTIESGGVWEGVSGQTYYFSGTDWIAGNGSYTGSAGTVRFDRLGGNQYIRQHTTGAANAVEFHNLSFEGSTSRVELGRILNSVQYDGNVDLTGDLYIDNSINEFWAWTYLIQNVANPFGFSGTFTLEANETIDVRGTNNYPAGFATYNVDATSFTRFYATGPQTIRGRINDTDPSVVYGNVILDFASTKTLGGAVDINGYLEIREAILDVSTSNYSINIAGNWDNQQDGENGSFICRQGTVTFDGAGNTQNIYIGADGTQDFFNLIVNKSSGTASLQSNNINITGSLTCIGGTFTINNLRATISGNMNANNTGLFSSGNGATALYKLIGSATSHTIKTNGSVIPGNMEIAALTTTTYLLEDDLTLNNDFTLTSGIFEVNGHTANLCDGADNVTIFGDFRVSTDSRPAGTLALGPSTQVVVKPGGTFRIVGTSSNGAILTRRSGTTGRYNFNVVGEMGNPGTIHARYALMKFMGQDGIFLNEYSLIDQTNNFSYVTFNNGASGGKFLRIENTQDLLDVNGHAITNVSFPANPGGGATNVYKTTQTSGTIEFKDFSGNFSGESYDEDPNNLITWILPDVIYWTGLSSSDWFTNNNWYNGNDNTRVVPTSSDDVIIPTFGIPFTVGSETFTVINEPIIGLPYTGYVTQQATAKNVTIQTSAAIILNTDDNVDKGIGDAGIDPDLLIVNDLNFNTSSELESSGTNQDIISVGGAWNKLSGALLTAGTSEVILDFQAGIRTLDNGSDPFYDLTIDAEGTVQLGRAIVINNDFSITSGSFTQSNYQMTIGGNFRNYGNFDATLSTVLMLPNNTSDRYIRCGGDSFYNLLLGRQSPVSSSPKYLMEDDLYVLHNLDVVKGSGTLELDLNGNDIYQGNNDGTEDDTNIYGLMTVAGGETLYLTGDANWVVQNGGTLNFLGTSTSLTATATRQTGSTGGYNITVESGGTFRARYYTFAYLEGNLDSGNKRAGLWIKAGATTPNSTIEYPQDGDFTAEGNQPIPNTGYPTILNYGSFTNGQGYRYLTIDNNFSGSIDYIAREVSFGTGPTRNVARSNSATNNINFRNYSGLLSGALLEDDDFSATTGKVRWSSQYVVYLWTGAASTAWENANNWKLEDNTIPTDYPTDQSFVIIPARDNQRDITNTIVSPQRDPIWPAGLSRVADPYKIANLVLEPSPTANMGGKLYVNSGVTFTVSQNIEIGGNAELNVAGTGGISLGDSWINAGIFTPNQTTVTLISDDDEQFGGGVKFYNLVINSSTGAVFTSTADLDVENDFTITNGTYEVTNSTHDINIGGDFTVGASGTFTSISGSKVTFDGTSPQAISIANPSVSKFYNLDIDTDGTLSLNSNIVIDGDLVILAGATLSQGANNVELKGNWTNYGSFTAGTGRIVLNGTNTQNITGTSNQTFSTLEIANSSTFTVDVSLLKPTFITTSLVFTQGILESSESNYLQFNDGATYTGFTPSSSNTSYVIGPVRKLGNDDFIFPVGDLNRAAAIAISNLTDISNVFKAEYVTGQNTNAVVQTVFDSECSNCDTGLNRVSVNESWDLERVAGTQYPIIALYFPSTTFSQIFDFPKLVVSHYNSATSKWESLGNDNTGSIALGYVRAALTPTSLSPITFGNLLNGNNPLPVTLVSFTGKAVNKTVVLDWVTASEFNNAYFDVQRSEDGVTFETIGRVNGNGTTNIRHDYQFTDVEPMLGVNYYRLKQVDTNGVSEYSKVIAVSFSQEDLGGAQVLVYPNPSRNQEKVNVELKGFAPEREVSIQLIDLTGKVLNVSVSKTNKSGVLREALNLPAQMASGVYNLLIQDGERSYSKRIVIQ
ncbi:MAG: hypothetical protein OHK0038_06090 [Flammeovirgaceae bacterium]